MEPNADVARVLAEVAEILAIPADAMAVHPHARAVFRVVHEMHADGADRSDPVRTILARVGDRWTPLLVQLLEPAPIRFSRLRKIVATILDEEISKQILSEKLHGLERDGFVQRTDLGGARPAVEYSLTATGLQFAERIKELIVWSRSVIPQVRAARAHYPAD